MIRIEIISSLALTIFFGFLYYIGISKDDFIWELAGGMGILILGILVWATGFQMIESIPGTQYQNFTIGVGNSSYAISAPISIWMLQTIPTTEVFGLFIGLFGFVLVFYASITIIQTRREIELV